MNTVSIVIPTFNRASLLPETIDSCLRQTVECQIIVCDHGSTDNTAEIVESYGDRVRYIHRDQDFGPHFCWLDGVLHADGDLIHLQYDDDLIEPTYIEELTKLITDDVGFAFCSVTVFEESGVERSHLDNLFDRTLVSSKEAEKKLLGKLVSPACAIFRKRDLIDSLYQGGLPLQNHEYHGVGPDKFISLLCLLRYEKIAYLNKSLARFRSHDGSITISAHADKEKEEKIKKAYKEVKKYYKDLRFIKRLERLGIRKRR